MLTLSEVAHMRDTSREPARLPSELHDGDGRSRLPMQHLFDAERRPGNDIATAVDAATRLGNRADEDASR